MTVYLLTTRVGIGSHTIDIDKQRQYNNSFVNGIVLEIFSSGDFLWVCRFPGMFNLGIFIYNHVY